MWLRGSRSRFGAALALIALLTSSGAGWANGRFPRAQRLVEDASDPARLALYGTYGLVTTNDAGKTWAHVCEAATGPFGGEAPLLEVLPGARVVVSSDTGLRGATFPACDFRGLLEPALPTTVQDVTRVPQADSALVALLSEPDVAVGFRSALTRSNDGGVSWSPSVRVPGEVLGQGLTLDVAPGRPERVYLSGLDDAERGVLARSDNAGRTWSAFPIPGTSAAEMPYLAQIDARDADRLFVRTDTLKDYRGALQPDDALLYSADGGASFVRLFSRRAKLLGFALSPDGETLLLGYGNPVLYAYTVEPEQTGLYRLRTADLASASADAKLEKIFAGSVTCLRWTAQGVYACLAQAEQGFEAGLAPDAEFSLTNARPFRPLLDLKALQPLSCAPDSSAGACLTDPNNGWPFVCEKLGASCQLTAPAPETADHDAGCGCQLGRQSPPAWLIFSTWLGLACCERRRARSRRATCSDTNAA